MSNERSESAKLIKGINEVLSPELQLSEYSVHNLINGVVQNINVNNHSLAHLHAFLSAVKKTAEDQKLEIEKFKNQAKNEGWNCK